MTQTRDLIKKMADFFTGEEFYEKGEDARLELSPDDVRCMNEIIKACGNAISRQAVRDALYKLCNTNETLIENPWRDNPHIDALIDAIEELPSVNPQEPKWISVSERLPEEYHYVLVSTDAEEIFIADYLGKMNDGTDCFDDGDGMMWEGDVVAWMPLPEPYKAESEG